MSSEMERESDLCDTEQRMTTESVCENCIQKELAVALCKDCDRLLCDDCQQQHKKQVDTNKHEVKESRFANEIKSLYQCEDHKKSLDYFCGSCNKPVCDHCTKTMCRAHTVSVRSSIEKEMRERIEKVRTTETKFKHNKQYIESVVEKNKSFYLQCKGQIETKYQELADALEDEKQKLLQELEEVKNRNKASVDEHLKFVEDKLQEISESVASSESLLATPKEAKLMVKHKETLDELAKKNEYSWSTEEAPPRAWQLSYKPIRDYAAGFGKLLPKPRPNDIVIEGLGEKFKVGIENTFTVSVKVPDTVNKEDLSVGIIHKSQSRSNGMPISPTLTEVEKNKWNVSFSAYMQGIVSISVSACKVNMTVTPIDRPMETMTLKEGDKVERGPDWKWENQDGGEGNVGEVVGVKKGWVIVKWNNDKKTYDYRWGASSKFDLKLHSK